MRVWNSIRDENFMVYLVCVVCYCYEDAWPYFHALHTRLDGQ
jgi:hypothetical protein